MRCLIKVAGTDRTSLIHYETLMIEDVLTRQIDTCSFECHDFAIALKDEIVVSNEAETVRYFGGYVSGADKSREGAHDFYSVRCQDYTVRLETAFINKIYTAQTCKEIIADAFAQLADFDVSTYVQDGVTIDRMVCNRMSLRELIEKLCDLCGFDYYVDSWKNLRFFAKETNSAPFALTEAAKNIKNFVQSDDGTKVVNMVYVYGGSYLSEDFDSIYDSDGVATEVPLNYAFYPPDGYTAARVFVNTGSDETPAWTEKTVGIDGTDSLDDFDVLHNRDQKLLKFAVAPPELKLSVKVTGQYMSPLYAIIRDYASYGEYGVWMAEKVTDKNIQSKEMLWRTGKAELAKYRYGQRVYKATVTDDGLASGQLVTLTVPTWSISGTYLIQRVTTTFLSPAGQAQYDVEIGDYVPSLVDLLVKLKRLATPYLDIDEGESLQEFLDQLETLDLSEATDIHSDLFEYPPGVNRWIALPPAQGAGHNVQHEALALAESTNLTEHTTEDYQWDDGCKWGFATWK